MNAARKPSRWREVPAVRGARKPSSAARASGPRSCAPERGRPARPLASSETAGVDGLPCVPDEVRLPGDLRGARRLSSAGWLVRVTATRTRASAWRSEPLTAPLHAAFTLIELLLVIAIIAVLAALILPGLAQARQRAEGVVCLSNLKQLQLAFQLYADDNRGALTGVGGYVGETNAVNWVLGSMVPELTSFDFFITNAPALLQPGPGRLGPYLKTAGVYRCPSDRSRMLKGNKGAPRVRSYSMNQWFTTNLLTLQEGVLQFKHQDDFNKKAAAETYVLVDEHAATITWSAFGFRYDSGPDGYWAGGLPSSRHGRSGTLSFGDGHVEMHKWRDERTMPADLHGWRDWGYRVWLAEGSQDYHWMYDRTTQWNPGWPKFRE